MVLDSSTLFIVATSITGLLGVFLLMLWLQERNSPALAWWGAAYLMGASAVMLWGTRGSLHFFAPEVPSALLFIACGMIWNGARLFHGRRVVPGALFAGALVWLLATQSSLFAQSEESRVVLSSVVIALYAFLTAFELRRERRRDLAAGWLSIAIPLSHSAVFLAPIALILLVPEKASADGLFALFAFETVIYVVGTAFVVVVMSKERVALVHKTASMTDPLTGLFNRRAFLDAADRMIAQRQRNSLPISVLLFDLDRFKSINDRFGHAVGDEALKLFATTATGNMRSSDVIGRLGGEEFAALLPGNAADAAMVAERLRAAFQAAAVAICGHEIGATVSVGVATGATPVHVESLLGQADAALYRAKAKGRNRIELANGETVVAARAPAIPPLGEVAIAMRYQPGNKRVSVRKRAIYPVRLASSRCGVPVRLSGPMPTCSRSKPMRCARALRLVAATPPRMSSKPN
jgi:diguanylate cyclase (GGDEF)-like protein